MDRMIQFSIESSSSSVDFQVQILLKVIKPVAAEKFEFKH